MAEMRIKNGLSLGPYGTAGATSAQSIFTPGDTTPDVSLGCFFQTVNTSATTITYFDLAGQDPVARNGKLITVLFQDALTTIQNGGNIFLSTTQAAIGANTVIDFVFYNSSWIEKSRSNNNQASTVQVSSFRRLNLSQAGSVAINVTTADTVVLTSTGADLGVTGFVGGVANQKITVIFIGTGGQTFSFAQSAGNLTLAGTNGLAAGASSAYQFYTATGSLWYSLPAEVAP